MIKSSDEEIINKDKTHTETSDIDKQLNPVSHIDKHIG